MMLVEENMVSYQDHFLLDDGSIQWRSLGFYDDPKFDYWNLDKEETEEKEIPNQGRGYKDYFKSIGDNVNKLKDALEDGWKL